MLIPVSLLLTCQDVADIIYRMQYACPDYYFPQGNICAIGPVAVKVAEVISCSVLDVTPSSFTDEAILNIRGFHLWCEAPMRP